MKARTYRFTSLLALFVAGSACRHQADSASTAKEFAPIKVTGADHIIEPSPLKLLRAGSVTQVAERLYMDEPQDEVHEGEYPHPYEDQTSFALRVRFPALTSQQFETLRQTYGGPAEATFQPNRKYELLDFMPPMIQALANKRFYSQDDLVPSQTTTGGLKIKTNVASNCWNVAYEFMRRDAKSFNVFLTANLEALDKVFHDSEYSTLVKHYQPLDETGESDTAARNAGLMPGDVIMVYWADDGGPEILQHTAIFIDDDVYFERTGPDDILAFRLSEARWIFGYFGGAALKTHWEIRRRTAKPFPLPDAAFSLKALAPNSPLVQELPPGLAEHVLNDSVSRSETAVNVGLIAPVDYKWSNAKQRYELKPSAFKPAPSLSLSECA